MNSFNDRQIEIIKSYHNSMKRALNAWELNEFNKIKSSLEKILENFETENKKEVDSKE